MSLSRKPPTPVQAPGHRAHPGIVWEHLPQELGFGSGMTCWRRLAEWTEPGVWPWLHKILLAKLRSAAEPERPSTGPRRSPARSSDRRQPVPARTSSSGNRAVAVRSSGSPPMLEIRG